MSVTNIKQPTVYVLENKATKKEFTASAVTFERTLKALTAKPEGAAEADKALYTVKKK